METGLARDPVDRSQMMQVMANTYVNLGLYARAHELTKKALDARMSMLGSDDSKTLEWIGQLGWILQGHYGEAEPVYRRLLGVEQQALGANHPETLKALANLAMVINYQDRYSEAEPLYREALTIRERVLGPEHEKTATVMQNLAGLLVAEGHLLEGEQYGPPASRPTTIFRA